METKYYIYIIISLIICYAAIIYFNEKYHKLKISDVYYNINYDIIAISFRTIILSYMNNDPFIHIRNPISSTLGKIILISITVVIFHLIIRPYIIGHKNENNSPNDLDI